MSSSSNWAGPRCRQAYAPVRPAVKRAAAAMAGIGLLAAAAAVPEAALAGLEIVLVPGADYRWRHPAREGLERWGRYLLCRDARSALASTERALDHIEGYEDEHGHPFGSHLDFELDADPGCERLDTVEFTPVDPQPEALPPGVAWVMVYLPEEEAEHATHRCADRPCALAPRPRTFIAVRRLDGPASGEALLAVPPGIRVRTVPPREER